MYLFKQFSFCLILLAGVVEFVQTKCALKNSDLAAKRNPYLCTNGYLERGPLIADPENCQCYFHCTYQQEPCYTCCPDGQVYHAEKQRCLPSSSYRCVDQEAKFKCSNRGLYANDQHCRKYWDCNTRDLMPVEMACDQGHHWDRQQKVCRRDQEVERIAGDIESGCVRQ